jgi:FemAB-related protein (PEP-CTERM system-associated)
LSERGALHIKRLDSTQPDQVARWEAFVAACPKATFFHRAGWQTVIRDVFRHPTYFLFAEQDGQILGVLPLAHVNSRLFGNALTGLPFAVYGGVATESEEAATALEAEAQRLAVELGTDHLELRHTERRHTDWPVQELYVTFRKAILPKEEDNMLAIPRKQRAMVRKGIKNGLTSQVDTNADRFFALYADNVHRHGTPAFSKRYFQTLLKTFGKDCEVLTVSSAEGRPLSSVLSFYFRDEVLPY